MIVKRMMGTSAIKTIGIIGAGQMGVGIAQVSALTAKKTVVLLDASQPQLQKANDFIKLMLSKQVTKQKITEEEKQDALGRIVTTGNIKDFAQVDFAIEAVSESPTLKRELFANLDKVMPKHAIMSTNTSSISITKIASATKRPESVIGMHFMNPVPLMKLVEVIPGLATNKATLEATIALASELDKTTTISKDVPGFIANRILMPYINEAAYVLQEGIATKDHIDTTMKLGS